MRSLYKLFVDIDKNNDRLYKSIKSEINSIKVIFNPSEHSIEEITQEFLNYRRDNSYSILNPLFMLNYFAKTRPKYLNIVPVLFPLLFSDKNKNQSIFENTKFHSQTCIYNLVQSLFPPDIDQGYNDIPKAYGLIDESVFPQGTLFSFIFQDNKEELIQYLAKYPNLDLNKQYKLPIEVAAAFFQGEEQINLIDLCCFFGSFSCFGYLIQNGANVTAITNHMAIAGASNEIIHALEQQNCSFDYCLTTAVQQNRNQLCDWLLTNYSCEDVSFEICLSSFNFEAFAFFFHNATIKLETPLASIYNEAIKAAKDHEHTILANFLRIQQKIMPNSK